MAKTKQKTETVETPAAPKAAKAKAPRAKALPSFNAEPKEEQKPSRSGSLRQTAIEFLHGGPRTLTSIVELTQRWYENRGSFPKSKTYERAVELVKLINSENGYGLSSEVKDGEVVITLVA